MAEITVVYVTDDNYTVPTYISAFSLCKSAKEKRTIDIYFICDSVSEQAICLFKTLKTKDINIKIIETSENIIKKSEYDVSDRVVHVTLAALYKLCIPNLITEDKALYIDGDTIITKDLLELFETNISDYYVAAANEWLDDIKDGKSSFAKRINLERQSYFNSGVMLLNLYKMRKDNMVDKLLRYRKEGINLFMDQDCFNAVLEDYRLPLSHKYNFMSTITEVLEPEEIGDRYLGTRFNSIDDCINFASIIHLTDKKKPWIYNMPWFSELFFRYYNDSVLCDEKIILKSPIKAMRSDIECLTKIIKELRSKYKYRLPYTKIDKGSKVILYGAGVVGKDLYKSSKEDEYCEVSLWVDKRYDLENGIYPPSQIRKTDFDYIIIASVKKQNIEEIWKELTNTLGVSENKIIKMIDEEKI